jgi:putative ABC transport system ATP-binding protein
MIIQASGLKKIYHRGGNEVLALNQVSLDIPEGQFVSIMGPSGSGKSTLLHLLGGLDRATAGEVLIEGQNLNKLSDQDLSRFRRRRLGFIFQFFNLLPTMSALENVCLPQLLDGKKMSEIKEDAVSLLEQLGLGNRYEHSPDQLSGGEMQRVAIARALVNKPALILADEPTGNLDSKTGTAVLEILSQMSKERKQTILMVTHSKEAAAFAHRKIEMKDGKIILDE